MRKSTKTVAPAPAPIVVELPPGYQAGQAVNTAIVNGVTTLGSSIADGATYVGTRILNFGKGLFNVHPPR